MTHLDIQAYLLPPDPERRGLDLKVVRIRRSEGEGWTTSFLNIAFTDFLVKQNTQVYKPGIAGIVSSPGRHVHQLVLYHEETDTQLKVCADTVHIELAT